MVVLSFFGIFLAFGPAAGSFFVFRSVYLFVCCVLRLFLVSVCVFNRDCVCSVVVGRCSAADQLRAWSHQGLIVIVEHTRITIMKIMRN